VDWLLGSFLTRGTVLYKELCWGIPEDITDFADFADFAGLVVFFSVGLGRGVLTQVLLILVVCMCYL
jgi:hypothetical protein